MVIPNEGMSAMGTGTSEDMGRTDGDPGMIISNYIYVSTGAVPEFVLENHLE